MAVEKEIILIWRDEDYGSCAGGDQAFRYMKEPYPSETESTKLVRLFKKHGFVANMTRASYIAQWKPADSCVNLVRALQEAGYTVVNEGRVPRVLSEALEEDAPKNGM